jgi:hypothetical protein
MSTRSAQVVGFAGDFEDSVGNFDVGAPPTPNSVFSDADYWGEEEDRDLSDVEHEEDDSCFPRLTAAALASHEEYHATIEEEKACALQASLNTQYRRQNQKMWAVALFVLVIFGVDMRYHATNRPQEQLFRPVLATAEAMPVAMPEPVPALKLDQTKVSRHHVYSRPSTTRPVDSFAVPRKAAAVPVGPVCRQ